MTDFEAEFDDELLSAYLDDELTPEERARVEERLKADPRARQLLDELRAVSRVMKELPPATLGADLRETVLRRAERAMLVSGKRDSAGGPNEIGRRMPFGRSKRAWFWAGTAIAAGLMLMVFERELGRNEELPDAVALKAPLPPLTVRSTDKAEEETVDAVAAAPAASVPASGSIADRADASGGVGGAGAEMDASTVENTVGDDLLVVHVTVKPEALQNRSINAVFARNSIEVEETQVDEERAAEPSDVDVVLVEAAPAQVSACLKELDADTGNYLGIEVDERFTTKEQSPATQQLAEDLRQHNRGTVLQRQKIELAPNNNLSYQSNRGRVEFDRYSIDEGADESGRARQLLSQNAPATANQGRAVRFAPQATGQGLAAGQDAVTALGDEAASGYRSSAAAADNLYSETKQKLARRAVQKLAAKADVLQVLFVLTAGAEPAAAKPTTSPPAEDSVR